MTTANGQPQGQPEPEREQYEFDLEAEAQALDDLIDLVQLFLQALNHQLKTRVDNLDPEMIKIMEKIRNMAEAVLSKRLRPRLERVQKDIQLFGVTRSPKTGIPLEDVDDEPLPPDPPPRPNK